MKVEVIESPDQSIADFFEKRIEEFNLARWEVTEKKPIAVKVTDDDGELVAGAAGKTFFWALATSRQSLGCRVQPRSGFGLKDSRRS